MSYLRLLLILNNQAFAITRGEIEDTRLEAKDTKKIQGLGQTLSRPRTGMLEAKAKDQGHKRKCSPKKEKGLHKNFLGNLQKKKKKERSSQKFFRRLTIQKLVLSSSRGLANFRGLEAKAKDFKMCPRGLHLWLLLHLGFCFRI